MNYSRRKFLHRTGVMSAAGLANQLDLLSLSAAHAQTAGDYKALVCVFLFGGVDGNNLIVPTDSAGYNLYANIRPTSSSVNLSQASLLPLQLGSANGPYGSYGLHPDLSELQTLFNQRKLAVIANVGTLLQPTSKTQYLAGQVPANLFSHSDQVAEWQSAVVTGQSRIGWGGRVADKVASLNSGVNFPTITSLAGSSLFTVGETGTPLALPSRGTFGLQGYSSSAASTARLAALQQILGLDRDNTFVISAGDMTNQAIGLSNTVNTIISGNSTVQNLFAGLTGNSIADQLLQVAKLIEARQTTGLRRQIFFVSQGGYDTHNAQATTMQTLLGQLSPALKAFYDATVQLGVANQVTTFTLSDFGRTMKPAAGGGTDHAWGNHLFAIGGAVRGGEFYGQYPNLTLAGPNDADNRGRWIPTTSVDQYGATLASWFGVAASDLNTIFPNLSRFSSNNLGFMGV